MTTIVCNREGMAADTRVTSSGPMVHEDKIFRVGASLFGTAGDCSIGLLLLAWLKTTRNVDRLHKQIPVEHRDDAEIVELNPGGILVWSGWGVARRLQDKSYATGSGAMAALSLLRSGKSLKDSVAGAIELDECSGPPIQVEMLKPKRKR